MRDDSAERAEGGGREPSLDRLAALSDGVFAVALTLLALDLRVPSVTDASVHKLLAALGGTGHASRRSR